MGSNDEAAFVAIAIFAVIYVCYKLCCHLYFDDETEEESAGQRALNTQNQHPARPYVIATRLTGYQPTQPNLPYPPKATGPPFIPLEPTAPYPERNLSEELDLPPSFEEAMKQISQQRQQNQ